MAGYGDSYRGNYSTYSHYDGARPPRMEDDWNRSSYSSDPAIADAEWRKNLVSPYGDPNKKIDYVITKTETVSVKAVLLPSSGEHSRNESREDYNRRSTPVSDRVQQKGDDEFLTNVQTGVTRKFPIGHLNAVNWRRNPNSSGYKGKGINHDSDHGVYNDLSNNDFHKPNRLDNHDDYSYNNNRKSNNGTEQPTMITDGGWARPSKATWSSPPNSSLTQPTNDIGQAMYYLKEAAKPHPVTVGALLSDTGFRAPVSTDLKGDAYTDHIIDNEESARVYNKFKLPGEQIVTYGEVIDNIEAARRYSGMRV